MSRRSNRNANISLALWFIAAPFKLVGAILEALDKAEEDKSRQHRREVLNYGTMSAANSRQIMNEKRVASIETERLRQEKLKADIELTKARTAYYQNANANFDPHALKGTDTPTYNMCAQGHYQSVSLGNTCRECGDFMTPQTLRVN